MRGMSKLLQVLHFVIDYWLPKTSRWIKNKKTVTFCSLLSSHLKTITMQAKNWISVGFIAAILIASVLVLNASTPKVEKAVTCCKKTSKECPVDTKPEAPAKTGLENLSHQFISLPVFLH